MATHIPAGTPVEIEDPSRTPANFTKATIVPKPAGWFAPNQHEQFHWVRYDNGCIVPVRDWHVRVLLTT
jgi:hypothetical protein